MESQDAFFEFAIVSGIEREIEIERDQVLSILKVKGSGQVIAAWAAGFVKGVESPDGASLKKNVEFFFKKRADPDGLFGQSVSEFLILSFDLKMQGVQRLSKPHQRQTKKREKCFHLVIPIAFPSDSIHKEIQWSGLSVKSHQSPYG